MPSDDDLRVSDKYLSPRSRRTGIERTLLIGFNESRDRYRLDRQAPADIAKSVKKHFREMISFLFFSSFASFCFQ